MTTSQNSHHQALAHPTAGTGKTNGLAEYIAPEELGRYDDTIQPEIADNRETKHSMSDKDPLLSENYQPDNTPDNDDNDTTDKDYLTPVTDEDWAPLLDECGDTLRKGARDGDTHQEQVVARSYTLNSARRYLGLQKQTIERAISAGHLPQFVDPEYRPRIPAYAIETLVNEPTYYEKIASFERLKARDIALVLGASNSATRRKLDKIGADRNSPT